MDVEEFGNVKREWLETFLDLPNGIPSHDTFGRVFSIIDAERFQQLFIEWANLRSAALVESKRMVNGERERLGRRYFITSIPGDAKRILGSVRSRWEVENSVHWTLDATFGEDASRARRGDSDVIMALFRRMALNLLRSEKSVKTSVRVKRKLAGWDTDYLLKVLTQ